MSTRFGVAGNSDTFTNTVSKSSLDESAWITTNTSAAEGSG